MCRCSAWSFSRERLNVVSKQISQAGPCRFKLTDSVTPVSNDGRAGNGSVDGEDDALDTVGSGGGVGDVEPVLTDDSGVGSLLVPVGVEIVGAIPAGRVGGRVEDTVLTLLDKRGSGGRQGREEECSAPQKRVFVHDCWCNRVTSVESERMFKERRSNAKNECRQEREGRSSLMKRMMMFWNGSTDGRSDLPLYNSRFDHDMDKMHPVSSTSSKRAERARCPRHELASTAPSVALDAAL